MARELKARLKSVRNSFRREHRSLMSKVRRTVSCSAIHQGRKIKIKKSCSNVEEQCTSVTHDNVPMDISPSSAHNIGQPDITITTPGETMPCAPGFNKTEDDDQENDNWDQEQIQDALLDCGGSNADSDEFDDEGFGEDNLPAMSRHTCTLRNGNVRHMTGIRPRGSAAVHSKMVHRRSKSNMEIQKCASQDDNSGLSGYDGKSTLPPRSRSSRDGFSRKDVTPNKASNLLRPNVDGRRGHMLMRQDSSYGSAADSLNSSLAEDSTGDATNVTQLTDNWSSDKNHVRHRHPSGVSQAPAVDPIEETSSRNSAESKNLQYKTNSSAGDNCKMAIEDLRKTVIEIFESDIADYVVHIGIEKGVVYVNVTSGSLEATESCLSTNFPQLYKCDQVRIFDGASAILPGVAVIRDNSKVNPHLRYGDSFSAIESGMNISYPETDKVKQLSKHNWEYKKGFDSKTVSSTYGTMGAVCIDDQTKQLYCVTAGHVYSTKGGYQTGTAHSTCFLMKDGEHTKHYVSDRYMSYMGSTQDGYGVDIAAIPMFQHTQDNVNINPFFSLPDYYSQKKSISDVRLSVFRGDSKSLVGRTVYKRGAVTGYTKGTIIGSEDVNVKLVLDGKPARIGYDCFLIHSDEKESFAEEGDSGALIVSDLGKGSDRYAYGIFFFIMLDCRPYKSKATGKPYERLYVCVRLDNALRKLNSVADLSLDLYVPDNRKRKRPTTMLQLSNTDMIKYKPCLRSPKRRESDKKSRRCVSLPDEVFMRSLCGLSETTKAYNSVDVLNDDIIRHT